MYRPGRKRRSTPPAEGTATAISSFTKYKIPTASENLFSPLTDSRDGTDAAADTPHDIAQNSDQRGIADHFEPLYPRERRSRNTGPPNSTINTCPTAINSSTKKERTASPQIVQHRMARFEAFWR